MATTPPDARAAADGRVGVCVLLAVPVVVVSGVPAAQFAHWPWICLTLAAPVVAWGGFPWLRRSAGALRGGSCADDVPVLLGTAGALAWSLAALMLGPAGEPGWTQPLWPDPASGPPVRLDVAAGVTVAVLAAGMLGARPPVTPGIARRAVVPVVLAVAAGALGYRLGAGFDAGTAISAAIATLLVAAPVVFDVRAPARPRRTLLSAHRGPTPGPRQLAAVHPTAGTDPDDVLRLAGSVAQPSEHPAARAVAAAAAERAEVPDVAEFDERPGLGVSGLVAELRDGCVDGGVTVVAHAVLVGHPDLLSGHDIALPADLEQARRDTEESGRTVVAVAWDGHARAVLALVADPAPDAGAAVRMVRRLRRPVGTVPWRTLGAVGYHLVALSAAASGVLDPLLAGLAGAVVTAVVVGRRSGPPGTVASGCGGSWPACPENRPDTLSPHRS